MRSDDYLLLDMLVAARNIHAFVAGMSFADLQANKMAQSAVIRELQVIGEAARRVSDAVRAEHAEIEWPLIIGLRNRLVHEYFAIRLDVVWDIVQEDIPSLMAQLERGIPPDSSSSSDVTS